MNEQSSRPAPSSSERALIEAARQQASPRPGRERSQDAVPPVGSIPGYDIVRQLHRGGQGVVYQAIQRATKRKVAVKILHESAFEGSRGEARFEREVEVLGQLQHPNIVSILDSGTADGARFLVMEYVSGRSLDVFIREEPGLSIVDALKLFAKICDAVNAAHLRGVIHRDIKPSNIMIDSQGEPHVLDFGLAKIAVGEVTDESQMRMMTMTGQFVGSLPWASPEQAEGSPGKIDVRTDVYSLGVTLYQMLTNGKFPYEVVGNMRHVLDNILRAEPARPSTIRRRINDEVETIVLKALAKERERRYQTAGELARDIQHFLNGEPVEAKRDSGWYVLSKTLRRHRTAAATIALFLLVIVGFSIAMSGLYINARNAAERATRARNEADAARLAEAEQRRQTEQHYRAWRELARTIMFDFHDEIAPRLGMTRAQKLLLDEALKYLAELESLDESDVEYQRELAVAHDRVGDMMSGRTLHGLGETAGAEEHYRVARQIRDANIEASPAASWAVSDIAESDVRAAWIAFRNGEYLVAQEAYELASAGFQRAAALAPPIDSSENRRLNDRRAETLIRIGDMLHYRAIDATTPEACEALSVQTAQMYDLAADYWRARTRAAPDEEHPARLFGISLDSNANAHILQGRRYMGWGNALAADEDIAAAGERYNRAIELFTEARSIGRRAQSEFEALAQDTRSNAELQRDVFRAFHTIGEATMRMGMAQDKLYDLTGDERYVAVARAAHEEGLEYFIQALTITEALASADSANMEARHDVVICLNKIGNEFLYLGDLESAREAYQRSLDERRILLRDDPIARHLRDLGVALYKRAKIEEAMADEAIDNPSERDHLEQAEVFYTEALEAFEKFGESGEMSENSAEIRQSESGIQRCQERLAKLEPA